MPDSQQPLPRTITVPEVQERSTVKRIHQKRRLAAKSACRDVMANAPTDESRSRMRKSQSRMRSRLSLDNPEIHSCYLKSTSESSLINRYGTRRRISRLQSYDVQKGDDRTGIKINPYCKKSPYRKCREEAPWSALTDRESQLEISQ